MTSSEYVLASSRYVPSRNRIVFSAPKSFFSFIYRILSRPVVRRLSRDLNIVHMAFLQPGPGDLDELAVAAHLVDGGAAGIAHGGAQAPDQLVDHRPGAALVGHLALDALGHQLVAGRVLLEIAIRRTAGHRAEAAHAAIALEAAALVEDHLAGALVGSGDHAADHGAGGPGSDRLGEIPRILDAAIGDHRHVAGGLGAIHDRGQLRHPDAGHHAGGADAARTDTDLDRVGPGIDQRPGRRAGGDVAGHDLHLVGQRLGPRHRHRDALGMAVGGVDHDHVDAGIDQRLGALEPGIADGAGRRHPQPAQPVLAGGRVEHRLLGILQRQKPGQLALRIGHQQLLDPPRLHQADRLLSVGRLVQHRQVVRTHHHPHRGAVVAGKAHVAVGDDADHPARGIDHRKAGDVVPVLQRLGIGQGLVGGEGDGVVDDATLEALDAADLLGLGGDVEIAVQHAHAPGLGHGDGHARLGDRVHGTGEQRNVHRDLARHAGRGVGG